MKRVALAFGIALTVVVAGCVIRTEHRIDAHVTLDIRHIDRQAEAVLDYMEGKTDTAPDLTPAPTSGAANQSTPWLSIFNPMQVAHAEENLKTESPRYKQIMQSIHNRAADLQRIKASGCVGETNRGYLELRDCAETADADRKNEIQQIMAEENADRKAFYGEIVRLNQADNAKITVNYIERLYAFKRLERASKGEAFQLPPNSPDAPAEYNFEAFQKTSLGQRLGDAAKPGVWVVVP